MKEKSVIQLFYVGVLLIAFAFSGCADKERAEMPKPGSKFTTNSGVYKKIVQSLDESDCEALGGCTCFIDGFETPCSIAFACLESGFCVLASN